MMMNENSSNSSKIVHPKDVPSIAVIIPCCNAEKWIARAIQSVIDQNCPSMVIIVIDDGSTDGSLGVIKSFGDKVTWKTGRNRGACAARNAGLESVDTTYVMFLDADDELGPGYFEYAEMRGATTTVDLFVGSRLNMKNGKALGSLIRPSGTEWKGLVLGLLEQNYLQTSQMLFRREFITKVGGWNTEITLCQDVELSLRVLLNKPNIGLLSPTSWSAYHLDENASRISCVPRRAHLIAHADIFCNMATLVLKSADQHVSFKFGEHLYILARELTEVPDYGRAKNCLRYSRALGFVGHVGTTRHKILSCLLGLFLKQKLASVFKSQVTRFCKVSRLGF
jgi:glycosyltransferase involved in cell wall biosynthesis